MSLVSFITHLTVAALLTAILELSAQTVTMTETTTYQYETNFTNFSLVIVDGNDNSTNTTTEPSFPPLPPKPLSGGAIAGIVLGSLVVVVAVLVIAFIVIKLRVKRKSRKPKSHTLLPHKEELNSVPHKEEVNLVPQKEEIAPHKDDGEDYMVPLQTAKVEPKVSIHDEDDAGENYVVMVPDVNRNRGDNSNITADQDGELYENGQEEDYYMNASAIQDMKSTANRQSVESSDDVYYNHAA